MKYQYFYRQSHLADLLDGLQRGAELGYQLKTFLIYQAGAYDELTWGVLIMERPDLGIAEDLPNIKLLASEEVSTNE